MAKPDETPSAESLPALRAASREPVGARLTVLAALAALATAALIVVIAIRPWRHRAAPDPAAVDPVQARFDAERHPERIIDALGIGPGARVADIGANTGLLTVHLARAVAPDGKVVATDIDAGVLDLLGQRIARAGLSAVVEPRVVPPDQPGLEPGAYDAILLSQVDHLFTDPAGWLREAKAALAPGGRIVITNVRAEREQGLAAAAAAGLHLVRETSPSATHYLAVFTAG